MDTANLSCTLYKKFHQYLANLSPHQLCMDISKCSRLVPPSIVLASSAEKPLTKASILSLPGVDHLTYPLQVPASNPASGR